MYSEAFPVVDAQAKIFCRRSDVKIAEQKKIPYIQAMYLGDEYTEGYEDLDRRNPLPVNPMDEEEQGIRESLLEQFMPACIVVDEKNDIVHSYGENGNYIHIPVGKFTNNIFNMITESLKIPVSTLLKKARETKQKEQYKDIAFKGERKEDSIILTAFPIGDNKKEEEELYALVFVEQSQRGGLPDAKVYDIDRIASQHITDLEQTLADVQDACCTISFHRGQDSWLCYYTY